MKDNLISRRAAVSRISDLLILELKGQRIPTWNEVYNAIGDIPSVPAVPLDKLCEWLENIFKDPPCMLENMVQCKQECRGFQKVKYRDCWRYFLNKWTEEQNEADRP